MILDSTVVHDVLRDVDAAVARLDELKETRTSVALSSLTVFEVGVGLRGESEQYREAFNDHVDGLVVLPVTEATAHRAISIQYELLDRGERIGPVDVLIASTAVGSPDPRVLTRNVDEFEQVDSLTVESY